MKRKMKITVSKKQWEGLGKKAGILDKGKENPSDNYWNQIELRRIGGSIALMVGDEAILYVKVEQLIGLLERLMGLLREEQREP